MIISFGDSATEDLYHGKKSKRVRKFPSTIIPVALRKLDMLNASSELEDLRVPPGNHLEALKGNYEGYYSIRINNQWRIVFQWEQVGPSKVSILDYH